MSVCSYYFSVSTLCYDNSYSEFHFFKLHLQNTTKKKSKTVIWTFILIAFFSHKQYAIPIGNIITSYSITLL